jgi:hypothetical protein
MHADQDLPRHCQHRDGFQLHYGIYPFISAWLPNANSLQYCPSPTTITYGSTTYPVTAPGTVIIPVVSITTCPITSSTYVPPISYPMGTGSAPPAIITSATKTPKSPSSSTTGPVQVTGNVAMKVDAGFGALAAAGLAALLL